MARRTQHPDRRQVVKAGLASVTGWAMDLHDLMIILFVAATIGQLLVPDGSPTLQLTFAYASFAVALVMRPAGSAIFGYLADRHGRKRTLIVAVSGVGVATALMGAVPTAATVGALAPILFVGLRLVQGVFVGGVVASTHTLGTETVPARHRGLMSGIISGGGAGLGAMLASLSYFVVSSLFPGEAFLTVGWRVMFFTGLLTSIICLVVMLRVSESPLWEAQHEQRDRHQVAPLRVLFSARYRGAFAANCLLIMGGAGLYYLTAGFFPTFFEVNLELPQSVSSTLLVFCHSGVIVGGVVAGALSDRIGRRRTFLAIGLVSLLAIPALYLLTAQQPASQAVTIGLCATLMSTLGMAVGGPMMIFLNERFPTRIRALGTALCWNIGYALGGMMPTLVTAASPDVTDIPSRLAMLVAFCGVCFLAAAALSPETRHVGLDGADSESAHPATTPA